MSKTILITGAVLGSDNSLVKTYHSLIDFIQNEKYIIYSPIDTMKFKGDDFERYQRAMKLLEKTDLIIAEMTNISTGQGMELQEAVRKDIPILIIAKKRNKDF